MTWEEVCDDPALQSLPYKVETSEWGYVEMSPARARHGDFQSWIAGLLQQRMSGGLAATEVGVETTEGVRVPDVMWASFNHRRRTRHEFAYEVAPEICVEIVSPTNTHEEQMHKGRLYLEAGAQEFWLCDELGDMRFFDADGPLERSRLCPEFPLKVILPDD